MYQANNSIYHSLFIRCYVIVYFFVVVFIIVKRHNFKIAKRDLFVLPSSLLSAFVIATQNIQNIRFLVKTRFPQLLICNTYNDWVLTSYTQIHNNFSFLQQVSFRLLVCNVSKQYHTYLMPNSCYH